MSGKNYPPIPLSHLESLVECATVGADEIQEIDSPVSIHIHSVRKRLADADGISAKAAIDALISAGILRDDSPGYVEEVTYSQAQGATEKTEITLRFTKEG